MAPLQRRLRKALSVQELGRAGGRLLGRVPGIAGPLGLARSGATFGAAADRSYARICHRDGHRLPVALRPFFHRHRSELGPAYDGTSLALDATVSVLGIRDATIFMATGTLHANRTGQLLVPDRVDHLLGRQLPALHGRSAHIAGPVMPMVGTPRGGSHYFHFLFDNLRSALQALRGCPELRRMTLVTRETLAPHQTAGFAYLARRYPELSIQSLPARARVTCDELVVVDRRVDARIQHFAGREDLEELAAAYRTSYGLGAAAPTRRLYLSRAGVRLRQLGNEDEVAAALAARGFEIIRPETLPHDAQVELFGTAAMVVGTSGAGFANLLFCAPGTRVVETCPHDLQYPYFAGLALQMGQQYAQVDGSAAGLRERYDLDVAALCATLDTLG